MGERWKTSPELSGELLTGHSLRGQGTCRPFQGNPRSQSPSLPPQELKLRQLHMVFLQRGSFSVRPQEGTRTWRIGRESMELVPVQPEVSLGGSVGRSGRQA